MPEEAPEVFDVNTDEGFNRALAKQTGNELTDAHLDKIKGSDRSVSSGLEYPESAQPGRDEKGRFTPAAPPAEPEPERAAPATTEPPADDPFAELIAQHGGDVRKALEAVAAERDNAQSVIGRQGNELGEVREKIAKLEGRLEATPTTPAPAPQFVPFTQIEAAIMEADDPEEAAPGVMAWVIEHGSVDQIDQTLNVWRQVDPVGAADFAARRAYFEEAARAEAEKGAQPTAVGQSDTDKWVAQQRLNEELGAELSKALSDVSPEERKALAPYLAKVWDEAPGYVKQAMVDPANRADVLGSLVGSARAKLVQDSITAAKAAGQPEVEAAKVAATVVSGANASPLPPESGKQGGERSPEEVSKALRDVLLATDTTSVSSGLTYGNAPKQ